MIVFYLMMALLAVIMAIELVKETDNQMWYLLILASLYFVGAIFCN